jgi:hypothetical protein
MELATGAFHLPRYLPLEKQILLIEACRFLVDGDVPAYVPVVRGGGKMHVRMLCLGRHWNGQTYRYEPIRTDFDRQPAPPLPDAFRELAREIADAVGMSLDPDLCILNYYDAEAGWDFTRTRTKAMPRSPEGSRSCRCRSATRRGSCLAGRDGARSRAVHCVGVGRRVCLRRTRATPISRCRPDHACDGRPGARPEGPFQPHISPVLGCYPVFTDSVTAEP